MSLKINYNVSAMIANNSLKLNDNKLTTSLGKLSSGYKINSAKDDAAGLAISRRMHAQLKGLKAASQDAKDGMSVIEIADGALAEVHDILQRMNELSIKSANGTLSTGQMVGGEYVPGDRDAIQAEIAQLAEEIDRIGQTTEYNSQRLFTGEFDLKGYTNVKEVKVDHYSDAIMYGKYTLDIGALEVTEDSKGNFTLESYNGSTDNKVKVQRPDSDPADVNDREEFVVSGDIYHLKFTGDNGDEFTLDVSALGWTKTANADGTNTYTVTGPTELEVDLTGYGAMTFQIGANEGQTLDIRFEKLSMETLGFKYQDSDETKKMSLDVSTQDGADKAIDQIKDAIGMISAMRSRLGAMQNRLEHTETNLATSDENMTAAYSRIMDTDMAEEMSNYSNLQIVSQAATAILAQANERPSQMLQLLQ